MYLKDASNVLLFVLADSTNGPTTLVLGFSELWTDTTTVLKHGYNNGYFLLYKKLNLFCLALIC